MIVTMNTLAPLIMADLGIGPTVMGFAMSAITISALFSAPIVGSLIDRVNPVKIMSIGLVFMASATALTGLATTPIMLITSRVLIGLTLPVLWPSCAKLVSTYIPRSMVGVATAIYDSGAAIGLGLSYVLASMVNTNWRGALLASALLGLSYPLVFATVLRRYVDKAPAHASGDPQQPNTRRSALFLGPVALLLLSFFLTLQTWGLLTSWIPTFLVKELGFSYSEVAVYVVTASIAASIAEIFGGWLSDRLGGLRGRRFIIGVGHGITVIVLLLLYLDMGRAADLALIMIAFVAYKYASLAFWAIINDVIPAEFVGRISGLYAMSAQVSMLVAPVLYGYIIEILGYLRPGFLYSAFTLLVSSFTYLSLKPLKLVND